MTKNMAITGTLEERAIELIAPKQPCVYSASDYRRVIAELLEKVQESSKRGYRSRKAFEAWISSAPYEREVLRFDDNADGLAWAGQYMDYEVALAWDAWQAGIQFNER